MQLESVSQCPACNSLESAYFIENRHDYVCGLSGTWSFRKCHKCKSLWIDPRPIKEMIPFLYPENYTFTHGQPANPLKEPDGFLQRLLFAIKLGTLDQLFGYKGISSKASLSWGVALGKIISYFPRISKRAGYTVRYLSCIPSGNLLEVGVGNGSFLWLMSALGWQVTGIEPDPEAAKAATATGLTIIPCDIESAELQDSYYDAIVLHHVLEHLPNPRIALSKLVKSLKSGGTLVSISPNPAGLIADLFGQNWYQLDPPRHLVLPTSQGYKSLLEEELVELNISTTMQTSFWIFKESLSLRYTGKTGTYQGWLLPKIFSWISSFFLSVKPNSGEEVICVAVKK
jgi:2-polyprenyl-3-methyl-5-hydroxy-6-metoxy-1,4-benzoquinol methylase